MSRIYARTSPTDHHRMNRCGSTRIRDLLASTLAYFGLPEQRLTERRNTLSLQSDYHTSRSVSIAILVSLGQFSAALEHYFRILRPPHLGKDLWIRFFVCPRSLWSVSNTSPSSGDHDTGLVISRFGASKEHIRFR